MINIRDNNIVYNLLYNIINTFIYIYFYFIQIIFIMLILLLLLNY